MKNPDLIEIPSKFPGACARVLSSQALALAAALFCFLLLPPTARLYGAGQGNYDIKSDYPSAKEDIQSFELSVNSVINSTFSASPFAVVQKAKGAYVPGHGISLSFLINIHRAVINTPFGQVRSRTAVTPEVKKKRIEELKEKLIGVLQGSGGSFKRLPKDDSVTIIAFIEDRNFPDEPSSNKTIVLTVFKKDLDELGQGNRLKEFRQRMKIFEY